MTQEDKKLLLIDLCARLPYGVILSVTLKDKYDDIVNRNIELTEHNIGYITKASNWQEYKPYLRPMSSMTEEEKKYISDKCGFSSIGPIGGNFVPVMPILSADWLIDFYNENHLDYRGLIENGLALPALEGMYVIK